MTSVFIYQAVLPTIPAAVLSVRALPVRPQRGWQLGGELPGRAFRIIIRYAVEDGRVVAHRGLLRTALPPGQRLRVAAWQVDGAHVTVTLAPPGRPRQRRSRRCVADRFRLPLSFQAWGVTSLIEVAVHLRAWARGQRDALQICGAVTVRLYTPAAALRIRRPFARLLAMPGAEDLSWRVDGGASRLQLRVHPGGRITGEVELALYYEGRPPGAPLGVDPGGILQVRDLQATVKDVRAEALSAGFVLVQGTVALDVYWVGQGHRSRWTGRHVPFSGVARLGAAEEGDRLGAAEEDGRLCPVQAGDRLEAQAVVTRIQPLPRQGPGWAALLISAAVTQFRTSDVRLGQRCYRLEEVVGEGTVPVERIVQWADPDCLAGIQEHAQVMADLRPPGLWQGLEVDLTGRVLPGDRWRVQGRLTAVPGQNGGWSDAGEAAAARGPAEADSGTALGAPATVGDEGRQGVVPSPVHGAEVRRLSGVWDGELPPGTGQGAVVLPWMVRVGPAGADARAALLTGCGEDAPAVCRTGSDGAGGGAARFGLAGPVRWLLELQASGGASPRVQALLAGAGGTLLLARRLPASLGAEPPAALLAYPVEQEGTWQLVIEWTPECPLHCHSVR